MITKDTSENEIRRRFAGLSDHKFRLRLRNEHRFSFILCWTLISCTLGLPHVLSIVVHFGTDLVRPGGIEDHTNGGKSDRRSKRKNALDNPGYRVLSLKRTVAALVFVLEQVNVLLEWVLQCENENFANGAKASHRKIFTPTNRRQSCRLKQLLGELIDSVNSTMKELHRGERIDAVDNEVLRKVYKIFDYLKALTTSSGSTSKTTRESVILVHEPLEKYADIGKGNCTTKNINSIEKCDRTYQNNEPYLGNCDKPDKTLDENKTLTASVNDSIGYSQTHENHPINPKDILSVNELQSTKNLHMTDSYKEIRSDQDRKMIVNETPCTDNMTTESSKEELQKRPKELGRNVDVSCQTDAPKGVTNLSGSMYETNKERQKVVEPGELFPEEVSERIDCSETKHVDEITRMKASISDFKRGQFPIPTAESRSSSCLIKPSDVHKIVDSSRMRTRSSFGTVLKVRRKSLEEQKFCKSPSSHLTDIQSLSRLKVSTKVTVYTVDNFSYNMIARQHPSVVNGISWDNFERETMRIASFVPYPTSAVKSPRLLAEAGFVYTGDGSNDKVICFFCYAEKENWNSDDNIEDVHRQLSPSCPMVVVTMTNNVSATTVSVTSASDRSQTNGASRYPVAASTTDRASSSSSSSRRRPPPPASATGIDEVDSPNHSQSSLSRSQRRRRQRQRRQQNRNPQASDDTPPTNHTRRESSSSSSGGLQDQDQPRSSAQNRSSNSQDQQQLNTPDQHPSNNSQAQQQPSRASTPSANPQRHSNTSIQNLELGQNAPPLAGQQNHHPVINSQIYAIPPNPRPPSPAEEEEFRTVSTSAASNYNSVPRQLNYQALGIFHGRPKHQEYAVCVTRSQTFEFWPRDHPLKPEDLVRSGLYYAGYGDSCRCFFCGGGLRSWDKEDDPFVEHARWFPRCGYIRQYMGNNFVEAVQQLNVQGGTITLKQVEAYMKENGLCVQNESNDTPIEEDAAVRSVVEEGYDKEKVCRAAKTLLESGEPLSADAILAKVHETEVPETNGAAGATPQSENTRKNESIEELKDKNHALRNNLTCKICMDKQVRMVFLPCGHLVACQECAVALQDCPVCRKHIRATVRANIA